jgi:hypothetical protein
MRTTSLALLVFAASVTGARAQSVAIDDLAAPQSPAFILLGVSPANVERPETPKALTLNLIDKVTTANGLPRNYALSVAPYWLASHPNLTFEQYQNPDVKQSILQTFLLSVGTVPLPGATSSADPIGTKIGLGVRTAIFNGRANPRLALAIAELEPVDDIILDLAEKVAELKKVIAKNPKDAEATKNLAAAEQELATARKEAASVTLNLQALDAERVGFFLTVAGGQVWSVLDDDTSRARAEKRGFWVTPSYRWRGCAAMAECESSFEAIAVVRTLKEPELDAVVDYGARAVWKANKQFTVSIEALRRNQSEDSVEDDSNRTVGLLEYRIRQDLILFGSFGKDFKDITGTKPLVSLLGLNLGFGKASVIKAR